MKAVVQRVKSAQVTVDGRIVGQIQQGWLVLLGVLEGDQEEEANWLAKKIIQLRAFGDQEGKMNLSLAQIGGELLVVSQFTLAGDCKRGNRPSFVQAAHPERAEALYEYFLQACATQGVRPQKGKFGADMQVSLQNDGPVTLILDTRSLST